MIFKIISSLYKYALSIYKKKFREELYQLAVNYLSIFLSFISLINIHIMCITIDISATKILEKL